MQTLYTKGGGHLGDNIYCLIMFSKITDYLETNNIKLNHYCDAEHINQIKEFPTSENINILPLTEIPGDVKVYNLWVGSGDYEANWYNSLEKSTIPGMPSEQYFDKFLCRFYNDVLKTMNVSIVIDEFIFDDDRTLNDLIVRNKNIHEKFNNKYNNIDILIVNGAPRSKQYTYNEELWDTNIILLSKKYNLVTTKKVEGIICTRDDDLLAKDIAAISINVKKIIAIDSGVSLGLFNKHTIKNAETIYYLCDCQSLDRDLGLGLGLGLRCTCSFPNFDSTKNIEEITSLLLSDKKESFTNYNLYNYCFTYLLFLVLFILIVWIKREFIYNGFVRLKKFIRN